MITKAQEILKKHFGFDHFRPQQAEIIERVLDKKDALVLMPTGGGKSICFQIPALLMDGTCIVVSPLISLMKDQVDALKTNGISAEFLNSTQTFPEQQQILEDCYLGKIKLLYVSPEKLLSDLDQIIRMAKPALFAIDEAHCISSWGHDFRPEYTQMGFLREKFPDIPFIALTATADKLTRRDISKQLKLKEPRLFISSFDRKNLSLDVRIGVKPKQKTEEIIDFIRTRKDQSGIIYCLSRKKCEELAGNLKSAGIKANYYHAGMDPDKRAKVQEDFINDELQIVCATIAFGMGIDKSNVRWVIHFNMPKNMEGYYQEIGRAGRDGLPSETILYYSYADIILLNKFASQGKQSEINLEKLKRIQHYAEADSCRRKILLNYFSETLPENCGNCDVCKNPRKHFDATILVQKALSAVFRMKEKEGAQMIIDVLRGSMRAEIVFAKYDQLKTHGAGAEISATDWQRYLMQMLNLGVLEIAYDENFALKITPAGKDILFAQKKIELTVLQILDRTEIVSKEKKTRTSVSANEELFDLLRKVRQDFALKEKVPAYIIFSDATLQAMVSEKPRNHHDMLDLPGIGEHKFARYGQAFLNAIVEFLGNHSGKKEKGDTYKQTLNLYQQGLDPEEISVQRKMSLQTVYSHFAYLFLRGNIHNLDEFVSWQEVENVKKAMAFLRQKSKAMKPIFDHLNESISYLKIRLALAVIEKQETDQKL